MTYMIDTRNGQHAETRSMDSAVKVARRLLGAKRLYRGAEYQTDRPGKGDERELCTGLDMWESRRNAHTENGSMADAVISW